VAPSGSGGRRPPGARPINPHSVDPGRAVAPIGTGWGFLRSDPMASRLLVMILHPNGVAYALGGRSAYVSDSLRRCVTDHRKAGWLVGTQHFCPFDGALRTGWRWPAMDPLKWHALRLASEVVSSSPTETCDSYPNPRPAYDERAFGGEDLRTGSYSVAYGRKQRCCSPSGADRGLLAEPTCDDAAKKLDRLGSPGFSALTSTRQPRRYLSRLCRVLRR